MMEVGGWMAKRGLMPSFWKKKKYVIFVSIIAISEFGNLRMYIRIFETIVVD